MEHEERELLAEPAVVARSRGLEPREVLVELLLREKDGPVDALEHRVPLVALPVRAGRVRELEDAELARRRHVRAAAEVDEVLLLVAREAALGNARDDLDLERIVLGLEDLHGLGLRHLLADDGVVLGDDPLHLGLDLLEVLGRERPARVEVVIEAVLDGRPDADLHAREEALDGVRAEVRRGVAVQLQRVRMLRRDDLERARTSARGRERSRTSPSSFTARASLARRGPIDSATARPVVPEGTSRTEPSGSVRRSTSPLLRPTFHFASRSPPRTYQTLFPFSRKSLLLFVLPNKKTFTTRVEGGKRGW